MFHSNMCSWAYQERVYEDEQGGGGASAEGGRRLRLHDGVHQRGVRHREAVPAHTDWRPPRQQGIRHWTPAKYVIGG
jgi:hypothetical protein